MCFRQGFRFEASTGSKLIDRVTLPRLKSIFSWISIISHYLLLSGTPPDFTVELTQPLNLEGEWEVGLVEMVGFPPVSSLYYILCEYSVLNFHLLPVLLRCIFAERSFLKEVYLPTLYLPISKTRMQCVRICTSMELQ